MKKWITEIRAKSPITGEITTYGGPNVPGITINDAQDYCENNGLGYCKVIGELIMEIPCKEEDGNPYTPDFDNAVDYEQPNLN